MPDTQVPHQRPEAPQPGVPPPHNRSPLLVTTTVVLVVAAAAATIVLFAREHSANARQVELLKQEIDRGPVVRVARVRLEPAARVVTLPAEVRAEQRATLYAKVSG